MVLLFAATGCGGRPAVVAPPAPERPGAEAKKEVLPPMGFVIQVGAFSSVNNAIVLSEALRNLALDAYYFRHKSGLYKVRFGDFPSKELALTKAEDLHSKGVIDEYFIISPEDYPAAGARRRGQDQIRQEIIITAKSFIGVPYRWGGSSQKQGFDCSGLVQAVYQLNGLNLPRSSTQQWESGTPVRKTEMRRGDLVFFAISGGRKVDHVGIYLGENRFIHAPSRGKEIGVASLTNRYFKSRYVGARTYF